MKGTSLLSERPCVQTWCHIQSFFRDGGFMDSSRGIQGPSLSMFLLEMSLSLSLGFFSFIAEMFSTCRIESLAHFTLLYSLFMSHGFATFHSVFLSCAGLMPWQNNRVWINSLTIRMKATAYCTLHSVYCFFFSIVLHETMLHDNQINITLFCVIWAHYFIYYVLSTSLSQRNHLYFIFMHCRCFYPKCLTMHSSYPFFICSLDPQPLRCKHNVLPLQEHYRSHPMDVW